MRRDPNTINKKKNNFFPNETFPVSCFSKLLIKSTTQLLIFQLTIVSSKKKKKKKASVVDEKWTSLNPEQLSLKKMCKEHMNGRT